MNMSCAVNSQSLQAAVLPAHSLSSALRLLQLALTSSTSLQTVFNVYHTITTQSDGEW